MATQAFFNPRLGRRDPPRTPAAPQAEALSLGTVAPRIDEGTGVPASGRALIANAGVADRRGVSSASPRPASWKAHHLVPLYVSFALLSVAVNLGVQQIAVVALTGRTGAVFPLSMLCGTGAGFVSKYLLDKKFIFFDVSSGHRDEARKVALYAFFSVFTTALFWGTEAAFFGLFGTTAAKYAGAVIGLGLGYALKFALDRRFTFTGRNGGREGPTAAL